MVEIMVALAVVFLVVLVVAIYFAFDYYYEASAKRLLDEGKYDEAYKRYTSLLKRNPNKFVYKRNLAYTLEKLDKLYASIELYEELSSSYSWKNEEDGVDIYRRLADLYLRRFEFDKAESAIENYLRCHPSDLAASIKLVEISVSKGDINKAKRQLQTLKAVHPENFRIQHLLRLINSEQTEKEELIAFLNKHKDELTIKSETTKAYSFN